MAFAKAEALPCSGVWHRNHCLGVARKIERMGDPVGDMDRDTTPRQWRQKTRGSNPSQMIAGYAVVIPAVVASERTLTNPGTVIGSAIVSISPRTPYNGELATRRVRAASV